MPSKDCSMPSWTSPIRSNLSQSKPDNAWAQEIAEKIRSLSLDDIPVCSQDAFQGLSTEAKEATILIAAITATWRRDRLDEFGPLRGWRDEMYTVFAKRGTPALMLERAACGLFGVVTYGAHLNAYVLPDPSLLPPKPSLEAIKAHRLRTRVWCPRRAMNKATYPGMLDNTVAGGISNGLSPFETIVKEADEEASIPEIVARTQILPVGVISYLYADGEVEDRAGYIQPEVQYCFDIEVADPREAGAIIPRPNDGESEAFELLDCNEILAIIKQGKFKPNCALVLIDFMIRRGILTEEDEPAYIELLERLHRRLPFPTR
ncbi:NUDIX hydrolase domain-like protein [Protomyces lactucae-debilis]|uniref:NUDIX hydrolase domain-like protein n=1 Tax=Protomyces lactucae-debilis TaxID=2754530 RepID=A0A1Y2FSI1_PROLT|nr:NUDIX hydrolase domain-like protein [Protomyces lactucae-debilis]ORY85675.1 NUDIX hydrolase domain-like protein [Protomyces lactucae-debilis]